MLEKMTIITNVATKYKRLQNSLSEKARRYWAATEAMSYGHGGIGLVSQATGIARSTIARGIKEIKAQSTLPPKRDRKAGGGRKKVT